MSKKLFSFILTVSLLCSIVLQVSAAEPQQPEQQNKSTVTIYTTNDIHGIVEESESTIGMAQAAGIVASTENALLVDAGDATQGASFATITQGADVIRMMNVAGYDVMTAGNHEFDYGAARLLANADLADFPILSANVSKDGSPLLENNVIITVNDYKIGFIGLTTTATATSTNPSQLEGIIFADELDTVKEQIAELTNKTDAIVLICHMGDNASAVNCTSEKLLAGLNTEELSKITAVVDGHSHTIENGTYAETSIPIIQTGTGFNSLGMVTLTFDENGVSAAGNIISYDEAMNFALTDSGKTAKQIVADTLTDIKAEQGSVLEKSLCTNNVPLWGGYIYYDYAEPRIVETNYGDFVTDAFAAYAKKFAKQQKLNLPVIAVENGGGISATLPYGSVTKGDVLNAFNHGNMVEVLKVTPAQLYNAIEAGLVTTGQDNNTGLLIRERVSGSFLQISGFSYIYDPAGESGKKVTSVILDNGVAVNRDDTNTQLLLATNNYVASFAAFADSEKMGELGGEDLIVENYILEQTKNGTVPLSVPTNANRIQITNDSSPDTYEVNIPITDIKSQNNEDTSALVNKIVHIRIDNGEYIEYVISSDGMINLTLDKGAHTVYLEESTDNKPVYVNNYSGSGTATTKEGYYRLGFVVDSTNLETFTELQPEEPEIPDNPNNPDNTAPDTSNAKNSYPITICILMTISATSMAIFPYAKRKKKQQ